MKNIKNIELFLDAFGKTPTFHDSEVVEVILKRKYKTKKCPKLLAVIFIKNYITKEMFLLNITFKYIFGLKLENFNYQNVLNDLKISDISDKHFEEYTGDERLLGLVSDQQIQRLKYQVKFEYCFGIEAEFLCSEVILDSFKKVTEEMLIDV